LTKSFFNENTGEIKDINEYHKSFYSAQNVNDIVSWAFDQGMSHQAKQEEIIGKNPTTSPRKTTPDPGGKPAFRLVDKGNPNIRPGGGLRIKK
jgi:hypothetical protein